MSESEPLSRPVSRPDQLPASADDVLPPVEAPSAGFLVQLFLIPLIIVGIIVAVWAMFSWLVQQGSDPRDLVQQIRVLNDASWQRAYTLSDLLRNPEFDYLKEDQALAGELAKVLQGEVEAAEMSEQRVKLRIYLSRVLGEFRLPDVAPALVAAAGAERQPQELLVRKNAVEALAVLAGNIGPEQLRRQPGAVEAVLDASRAPSAGDATDADRAELRSAAAFALGVLGGDEATERLAQMLGDAYLNSRYNAAAGLARQGDPRAVPVLVEMLDPANENGVASETTDAARALKRADIWTAAISSAARLSASPDEAALVPLIEALTRLEQADVPRAVRIQAQEARHALQSRDK